MWNEPVKRRIFVKWIKSEDMLLRSASKTPIATPTNNVFPTWAKKNSDYVKKSRKGGFKKFSGTILLSSVLRCWIWKVKWLWMIDQPGANNYNNYNDFNHFKIISIYRGCPVALFDYFFTCTQSVRARDSAL